MRTQQLADWIVKKFQQGDGFTITRQGELVEHGYAVASGTKPLKRPVKSLTSNEVLRWLDDNYHIWQEPTTVLGGWVDPQGLAWLEPVEVLDDKAQALMLGDLRGEQAIGDLHKYATGLDGTIPLAA